MKIVYPKKHHLHNCAQEIYHGQSVPCFEKPERAEIILRHVIKERLGDVVDADGDNLDVVLRIHDPIYVAFLRDAYRQWEAVYGACDALPYVWVPTNASMTEPDHIIAKLGYFSFDSGTPMGKGTYEAALNSAWAAVMAAQNLLAGDKTAFALCRPPGHHAGERLYGGYCFFNNAAVAAQFLRDHGVSRIAILDVDYHHGNGTQQIFYNRDDVLYVSLHADPAYYFPYFFGKADEVGSGFNMNLPLPALTDWKGYAEALMAALARIRDYAPDILLVSFGADTFKGDPISKFLLEHEDFIRMGERIGVLGVPTLVVMEGGYAIEDIGMNTANFLYGLRSKLG